MKKILIAAPPGCADEADWRERTARAIGRHAPDAVALRMPAAAPIMLWNRGDWLRAQFPGLALWVSRQDEVANSLDAEVLWLPADGLSAGLARTLLRTTTRIFRSCHSLEAVERALPKQDGIVLGNIFPTTSHPGRPPLGLPVLREAAALCRKAGKPLYAIGGIGPENLAAVEAAGAEGMMAISMFFGD
jgi:thiamine monophosphate synthase